MYVVSDARQDMGTRAYARPWFQGLIVTPGAQLVTRAALNAHVDLVYHLALCWRNVNVLGWSTQLRLALVMQLGRWRPAGLAMMAAAVAS